MSQFTNELLTPEQVAIELGLHQRTITRYIREKKLAAIRLTHRDIRIRRSELNRYLNERETDKVTD